MKNTLNQWVLMMGLGFFGVSVAQADLVYICHKDRNYSHSQIRNTYMGREETVRPVDNAGLQDQLLSYLGVSGTKYRDVWTRNFFRKAMATPPMKKSDQEVIDFVKNTPDSIGYVASAPSDAGVQVCGK